MQERPSYEDSNYTFMTHHCVWPIHTIVWNAVELWALLCTSWSPLLKH